MYGIVFYIGAKRFAAVSPSSRKVQVFLWEMHKKALAEDWPDGGNCNWRLRDKSGWVRGGPDAHKTIPDFPENAKVIW